MSLLLDPESVIARVAPEPDPYADDPIGWVRDRLGEHLWSKQREVAEAVRDERYVAVPSAHSTGKSHIASRLVAWWLDSHPVGEAFAVTTAPTSVQVKAILWRYIKRIARSAGLPGYITESDVPEWKIDGELVAYGRKPQDLSSPESAMQAFQGIHARYVLVVLDEAGGVPEWLWDAVDTLVTNSDSRVLAIGNPDDPASRFEKVCRPGSGWHAIPISAYDTPAFTREAAPEKLLHELVGEEWIEERKKRWGEASPLYISKVLGRFPEVADDTLISPALIRAAQDRELPGLEVGKYAADIARYGADETVVYRNREGVIRLALRRAKQDTMRTAGDLVRLLDPHRGEVPMVIDSVGVGAGVYDRLAEQGYPVQEFGAGEKAGEPNRYKNRRSEQWWMLRELLEDGLIDLDPEDEDLASQLGSIKWKSDSSGRIAAETKDELRKRGLPSPDRGDAVMMSTVATPDLEGFEVETRDTERESLTSDLLARSM